MIQDRVVLVHLVRFRVCSLLADLTASYCGMPRDAGLSTVHLWGALARITRTDGLMVRWNREVVCT